MKPSLAQLAARVIDRRADDRVLIGITGSPGAGKSTLAELLVAHLGSVLGAEQVAYLPMDGYHLADVELERIGRRDRKGAPDTFDAYGYVATLQRLRLNADPVVYVPGFDRDLEQPIAGSLPIFQSARVIVTEGNYLLLDDRWSGVRALLDEVWFCRPAEEVRLERLLERHIRFGKTPEFARTWIAQTDQPNAEMITATMQRADLLIDVD